MRGIAGTIVIAALMGMPAIAQQPQTTVQQDFDAATGFYQAKEYPKALAAWEALERRTAKNPRSQAIVHIRKSFVLFALDRKDEAVASARVGLAAMPASDATLRGDRYDAWFLLGRIAESTVDYASAAEAYRQALALTSSDTERLATYRGLIETETFVDPDAATADMARANALIATTKADPKARAVLKHVESQLLMNRGDFAGARTAAGEGVKLLGGLTSKTDLYDVAARSDYAIASLLDDKPEEARKYMAYTGAGRLENTTFDPAVQMKAPECGGEAGMKPDDIAVVEFSIDDDGAVGYAIPIYAAGGGRSALEFARAARTWSWTPEQVKALPVFFRYRARVEMRCSTAFERPSITNYLDAALGSWLAASQVALPPVPEGSDAAVLPGERRQLATTEAAQGADSLALVPVLQLLLQNSVVSREEKVGFARRALAIVDRHSVSPAARLAIERQVWANSYSDRSYGRGYVRDLATAMANPIYASDSQARAATRLLVLEYASTADPAKTKRLLNDVTGDAALQPNDPLRISALVRLASLEQASGNFQAAQTAFEQSGLSARQCAIVDSAPRRIGTPGGSFPQEAMLWGFEGWTQMQYDVSADGHVLNQRAVVSYPPFVFDKASGNVVKGARYEKTFRPDGGLGCGGQTSRVIFRLPH